jgi:beta-mannanase
MGSGTSGGLSALEQTVGKQANMQAVFVGWNQSFPTSLANSLKASGKTLVIFWEQYGVTVDSINSGSSDTYIRNFAAAAKASGASVILSPLHEMNGNWDPWGGTVGNNTPAKIISEWRRIHGLFAGVSNVKFAWDVNNISVPNTTANSIGAYYPGDAYVDYVAVDGFNFGSQTWDQVFPSSLMNQLSSYGKPIYILSTGSVPGSQKAQWIKDMGVGIKKYPKIAGWVWFNQDGGDGNWLINSDSASLSAFKSILP